MRRKDLSTRACVCGYVNKWEEWYEWVRIAKTGGRWEVKLIERWFSFDEHFAIQQAYPEFNEFYRHKQILFAFN